MKKETSFDSYSIVDTPFTINENEEKLPDDKKYDLVLFTNKPELWNNFKKDFESQIEYDKKAQIYLIDLLENNLKDFKGIDFWKNIHWSSINAKNEGFAKMTFKRKFLKEDIERIYEFTIKGLKRKNKEFKDTLIKFLCDISYNIGKIENSIHTTELALIVLRGEGINKEFGHITETSFLKDTKIKFKPYFIEYKKIKLDINYTEVERDFVLKLGYDKLNTWDFAFCILAYRHRENNHFNSCFINENEKLFKDINYSDLNNLLYFARIFHNAYSH